MGKLFDRIKETILRLSPSKLPADVSKEDVVPGDENLEHPDQPVDVVRPKPDYIPQARMTAAITQAGRAGVLIYIKYNDVGRYVEPYSFRNHKNGLLFYGHCLLHDRIHSFYVHRIQSMQISDIPFAARWHNEFV